MSWIFLTAFYGIGKGIREILKKFSQRRNSTEEVLFSFTFLSTVFIIPFCVVPALGGSVGAEGVFGLKEWWLFVVIAVKAFAVFLAWIFSFTAVKNLPMGVFSVLDLSRVIFATVFGCVFLGDTPGLPQYLGLALVLGGLLLLRLVDTRAVSREEEKKILPLYVIIAILSGLCNEVSATLDKYLMRFVNVNQLQFWYMIFLVLWYLLYMIVKKVRFDWRIYFTNWYIPLMVILFVAADRMIFLANADPMSTVSLMTLIKQVGVVVSIIGGAIFFKEKKVILRLLCAAVVIAGVVIAVL